MQVHQTIPEEFVLSFLERGHYFAPCGSFIDLMEFRYGYCLFNTADSSAGLAGCVRRTFQDDEINLCIDSTCVSCWTADSMERFAMWELYGKRAPAIRVSVDADRFEAYVRSTVKNAKVTSGRVTYAGQTSLVRPQFLRAAGGMTEKEDKIYHLFFHKHGFYQWEDEFRLILFSRRPVWIPLDPSQVDCLTISPFGTLDAAIEDKLRLSFGNRVQRSTLKSPYAS